MLRILLEVVLPFAAPFLVFVAWRLLVTRGRRLLEHIPWFALTTLGLVLVVASLASLAFLTGENPQQAYIPPHLEHGVVVPGRFVPASPPR
jgi:hypothetical protein